jgi:photosystem II stability/assembly factor-like uncharacterized protein
MKNITSILFVCALIFTNCKDSNTTIEDDPKLIRTTPFENNHFKIERASFNLPQAVTKIHFFDENNGISLSDSGSIFNTNDRGATWSLSYKLLNNDNCLRTLGFEVVNNQTIVAFASSPYCTLPNTDKRLNFSIRSTDKGKTWVDKNVNDSTLIKSITHDENQALYAVGQGIEGILDIRTAAILTSVDNGQTWKSLSTTNFGYLSNIFHFSPSKMLLVGPRSNTTNPRLISTDNGLTWNRILTSEFIQDVSFIDKTAYYLGQNNTKSVSYIYQSNDSGDNWTKVFTLNSTTNHVKMVSPTTTFIFGKSNSNLNAGFTYTFDGGKTWVDMTLLDNLDTGELITSSFYDSRNGYIVGSKKILYKITLKQ